MHDLYRRRWIARHLCPLRERIEIDLQQSQAHGQRTAVCAVETDKA